MTLSNPSPEENKADRKKGMSYDDYDALWPKWLGGIVVPMVPFYLAFKCWQTQKAFIPGRFGRSFDLTGREAIVMGLLLFACGLYLHFQYFWGNSRILRGFSDLGKTLSCVIFGGSLAYLLWYMWTVLVSYFYV